jgi:hypothetical protein
MKIQRMLLWVFVCTACIFGNCNKTKIPAIPTPSIVNLKTKSLSKLKSFLNGEWQIQYSVILGFAGYTKYPGDGSLLIFFPVDSIKWVDKTRTITSVLDKAIYTWKKSSYSQDSIFNISFRDAVLNNNYNLTADKSVNDTLVLVDNSIVGSSYYLTKK